MYNELKEIGLSDREEDVYELKKSLSILKQIPKIPTLSESKWVAGDRKIAKNPYFQ